MNQKTNLKVVLRELLCPMNWLEDWINKIQNASTSDTLSTESFFIKMKGKANDKQMTKIMQLVQEYDSFVKNTKLKYIDDDEEYNKQICEKSKEVTESIKKIKIGNIITINRLIEIALGLSNEEGASKRRKYSPEKYTRKILNLLYKTNKEKFMLSFNSDKCI